MTSGKSAFIETRFDSPGTLPKPGVIGRIARLLLGGLCLYPVLIFWMQPGALVRSAVPHWSTWVAILYAVYLFPPVVNIGFGVSWKAWPRYVDGGLIVLGVVAGWLVGDSWWTPVLGRYVWLTVFYVFGHLGLSFLLSAVIATPGCEMRAIPHLWTLVTGRATREHYCPGFLDRVDAWELQRK